MDKLVICFLAIIILIYFYSITGYSCFDKHQLDDEKKYY